MNRIQTLVFILAVLLFPSQSRSKLAAQGILLSSTGPVNRSMGGAAVAAPLEAIGALRWNPATISALPSSELGFGLDLVWPHLEIDSSIAGLGSGSTTASPGTSPVPSIGWIHRPEGSEYTFGLGVMGVGGFRSNYPSSATNPIVTPQSNTPGVPGGLGRIYTQAQFLDLAPTISIALSESFSVGISPFVTLGEIAVNPFVFGPPNDADGSGAARYPSSSGNEMQWGMGVQLGAYYIVDDAWRVGASLKSPTWMQPFVYQTQDELGLPLVKTFRWDLPMVASAGISYAGWESLLIALDLRYVDYANTDGFGGRGFNADGSVNGLGWRGVFCLALGVQKELSDTLSIRAGYTYNQSPTPDNQTTINIAAPLHYQHVVNAGGSYRLAENVWLNMAYSFYLPHDITGPIVTAAGAVPNSSVTSSEYVHVASLGVTVRY